MITNRTSEAVAQTMNWASKGITSFDRHEIFAICEKYKRMEEALKILSISDAGKRGVSIPMRNIVEKALSFDPLAR